MNNMKFFLAGIVLASTLGYGQCNNLTSGGSIGFSQTGGPGSFDPAAINNIALPSGGSGTIEYVWMQSNVPVANTPGNPYWSPIPNSDSTSYDPGSLTETTYFIRCARRSGCSSYVGESNMVIMTVTPTPVTNCLVYGVQDQKSNDFSQIFTVDPYNGNLVTPVGAPLNGWDIEGLEIDPITGILYAVSGNDNTHGFDGHFYTVDAVSGVLGLVGSTGYDDVVSLAFNPISNVLYAWGDDDGLMTINLSTGAGTIVYASPLDMDGMAWSNDGTILYCATDDMELFEFDPLTSTLTLVDNNLPGSVESLEMRPDDLLMFGVHLSSTTMYVYDPQSNQVLSAHNISTPYDDIESIVWPDWCDINLNAVATTTDVLCHGDSSGIASISITEGTAPYTYSWSNGNTSPSDSSLAAGIYNVVVTDANGLTDFLTFTINEPTPLSYTATSSNTICNGICDGMASVTVSGGSPGYAVDWYVEGTLFAAGTTTITGLCPDSYVFVITDTNGCTVSDTIQIEQPAPIVINATGSDALCNGTCTGEASINISGGAAPYNISWSNGINNVTALAELCAGAYYVTVTDSNGCSATDSVVINEPSPITVTIQTTDALCFNSCSGEAVATIAGGTAPYTINWSLGISNVNALAELCVGTYTVTVTDTYGCSITETFVINEPTELTATLQTTDATCPGNLADGTATATVLGGTTPYTYSWNNGTIGTDSLSNLVPGYYEITVTDTNGCSIVVGDSVMGTCCNVTNAGQIGYDQSNCGAFDPSPITSIAPASGGVGTIIYIWLCSDTLVANTTGNPYWQVIPGANSSTFDPGVLTQSKHYIRCARTSTCTAYVGESNVVSMLVFDSPVITSTASDVSCYGSCDGTAAVGISGGTAPFNVSWSNGISGVNALAELCAGTYYVTVTDTNGCSVSDSVQIGEPDPITGALNAFDPTNASSCNGYIEISNLVGGTAPFTYLWSNGATTQDIYNLCYGSYTVVITDANGCTASGTMTLGGIGSNLPTYSGAFALEYNENPEVHDLTSMHVYPNPVSETATVSLLTKRTGHYSVSVQSMTGATVKQIYKGEIQDNVAINYNVFFGDLEPGVYLVSAVSAQDHAVVRVVVTK